MGKINFYLVLGLFCLNSLGCASLIVGAAVGGAGVYAVSKDTVQGDTDKSYDSLWAAALTVSRIRGTIKKEDQLKGYIELQAEQSLVKIQLVRLTRLSSRIKISARKFHLPNLDLAQDFYTKIIEEAK
ncbi:MAG: DUF3568 family protein [Candidatus Omnitrophota bacterium]